MTWNKGSAFFDKQNSHTGAGSVARETLKWWASAFEKGLDIADPESLKVSSPAGPGVRHRQEPLSRTEPYTASISAMIRRSRRSPASQGPWLAGRGQDDRRHPCLLPVVGQPRQGVGVEAAAVPRRPHRDGNYAGRQPGEGCHAGLGHVSVMNSDAVKLGWAPWGDVPAILKIWNQAAISARSALRYQPWHFRTDQLNIEVQKCLHRQGRRTNAATT
jgi:hypothetical protein